MIFCRVRQSDNRYYVKTYHTVFQRATVLIKNRLGTTPFHEAIPLYCKILAKTGFPDTGLPEHRIESDPVKLFTDCYLLKRGQFNPYWLALNLYNFLSILVYIS